MFASASARTKTAGCMPLSSARAISAAYSVSLSHTLIALSRMCVGSAYMDQSIEVSVMVVATTATNVVSLVRYEKSVYAIRWNGVRHVVRLLREDK
jgi:hypothetical protein